jgi:glycosyltransferase involved in cell wall biosynthesis
MIIQAYHPIVGGAERQLGTIAPMLKSRGLDVHILTRRYPGLLSFELIDGIPVHRLAIPGPMPVASLIFTLAGLAALGRIRPDVIHAHELLSPTTTAVGAKILFGMPIVAKVLGGGAMGDISKLKRNPISAIRLNTILKKVDRFITISQEIACELNQAGIPEEKLISIPNGVDTARFRPADHEEKRKLETELNLPAGIKCIYTGRLEEEKNLAWLASNWRDIRSKNPQASLLVIGAGSEEKNIRQAASDGVYLLGEKSDVRPYLQSSDIFILPSKREGLSNALLEALACGLPAVATDVGGNRELIDDGVNGLLIPLNDSGRMAAAVNQLLDNSPARKQMSLKAREFILENYQIEKTVDRLIRLYDEVRAH